MRTLLMIGVSAAALVISCDFCHAQGPLGGGGIGSRLGSRIGQLKQRMTNKDSSVHYDPEILKPGVPRSRVHQTFGDPLASRDEEGVPEEAYGFYPDGSKYLNPHMGAGTVAMAVFTAGMSLAVRQARIAMQKQKITLYKLKYGSNDAIASVKVVPPKMIFDTPAMPSPAPTQ